jgi:predicted outer membrane protein
MSHPYRSSAPLRALAAVILLAGIAGCSGQAETPTAPAAPRVDDAVVNQARFECLSGKGFAVTQDATGSVSFVDPEDKQYADFQKAERECTRQLVQAGLVPAVTEQDLNGVYEGASALHACLTERGFPLTRWLTWEEFKDAEGRFNVLDASQPVDESAAQAACPAEFSALGASS